MMPIPLNAQSYFTLIDDDAHSVLSIREIEMIASERNINVCFGVVAKELKENSDIISELLLYQDEGHQIINHSFTHDGCIWQNPTRKSIDNEIVKSTEILDSLGFTNHDYFVYPWGRFERNVREWLLMEISPKFKLAFNSRGGSISLSNYNRYYINRYPLRKHDNISIVKYDIDKAMANKEWIVFLTHSGMTRDFDSQYVREVVDYCLQKGMKCITVKEAYDMLIKTSRLRTDETTDWTKRDEIIYLLYMHFWWVLSVLGLFMTLLIGAFYKYLK